MSSTLLQVRIDSAMLDSLKKIAQHRNLTVANFMRGEINRILYGSLADDRTNIAEDFHHMPLIGYQKITLQSNLLCELCKEKLSTGQLAFLAWLYQSTRSVLLCPACVELETLVKSDDAFFNK